MDASRRLWPRADFRVGDADRQAVLAELQRHYVEGRLTSEELGERVTQALQAKTFGDFAPILQDLPPLIDPTAPTQPAHEDASYTHWITPPIGALLLLVGMLALVWLFMAPGFHMMGLFPWPLLIWGFFFVGRPTRRRRF